MFQKVDVPHAWCELWMLMLSPSSLSSTLPWWLSINRRISGFVYLHIMQYHLPHSCHLWRDQSPGICEKANKELFVKRTEQHFSNAGSIAAAHKAYCVPGWHLDKVLSGPATHTNPWRRLWLTTRWRNYNMYKSWVPGWSKLTMAAKACIELVNCCFKSFGGAVVGVYARKPNKDAPNFLLVNPRNSSSDVIQYWSVLCLLVHFDTWQTHHDAIVCKLVPTFNFADHQ